MKSWASSLYGGTSWSKNLRNTNYYFKPGLTYIARTNQVFSVSVLPKECIFSHVGPALFFDNSKELAFLGLLNSALIESLLSLTMSRGGENSSQTKAYEVGRVQELPYVALDQSTTRLGQLSRKNIAFKRNLDTANELSHLYWLPALLQRAGDTLAARAVAWQARVAQSEAQLAANQREIDDIAFRLYGIEGEDRRAIEESLSHGNAEAQGKGEPADSDEADESSAEQTSVSLRLCGELSSYLVGCAVGRWDIRCATGARPRPALPDPFAPLPTHAPGMLVERPEDYPLAMCDILVDDPGHPDDIVARVREVIAAIWGQRADTIEQELVETLAPGSRDLRPWLRTAFFEEHIKRYSKSRRKAPIYWCLSTPSRTYAVWLYYHQLSKDTLYQLLNDYVGPKLALEERRLAGLRAEGGANPTAGQRKASEPQEGFVAELQGFRDELARAAPLWRPDLNDGVIINFAPLWRLAPWPRAWQKECRATWEALRRGDYDWSHLAMHLWPERVVEKCRADRSLAIAHGLDGVFWDEGDGGKAQPRDIGAPEVQALVAQRSSPAVRAALAALAEAPLEPEKPKKRAEEPRPAAGKRGRKAQGGAEQMGMELGEEV